MHAGQQEGQADAPLFILISGFAHCILYSLTRSTAITRQDLDLEFGIVDGALAKREKEVEKTCLSRRPDA